MVKSWTLVTRARPGSSDVIETGQKSWDVIVAVFFVERFIRLYGKGILSSGAGSGAAQHSVDFVSAWATWTMDTSKMNVSRSFWSGDNHEETVWSKYQMLCPHPWQYHYFVTRDNGLILWEKNFKNPMERGQRANFIMGALFACSRGEVEEAPVAEIRRTLSGPFSHDESSSWTRSRSPRSSKHKEKTHFPSNERNSEEDEHFTSVMTYELTSRTTDMIPLASDCYKQFDNSVTDNELHRHYSKLSSGRLVQFSKLQTYSLSHDFRSWPAITSRSMFKKTQQFFLLSRASWSAEHGRSIAMITDASRENESIQLHESEIRKEMTIIRSTMRQLSSDVDKQMYWETASKIRMIDRLNCARWQSFERLH